MSIFTNNPQVRKYKCDNSKRRYPISSIMGKTPSKTETTPFGTKHTYHTTLVGKDGKSVNARVVVVIQKTMEVPHIK